MISMQRHMCVSTAILLLSLVAASQTHGESETNAVINIWEQNGTCVQVGTNVYWDVVARNNSNILPAGNPYNEDCIEVRFHDVWSAAPPSFENINDFSAEVLAGSATGLYRIVLRSTYSYYAIGPGEQKTFEIITYVPKPTDRVRVGPCYGQGGLVSAGWQPDVPGDAFLGPVGLEPRTGEVAACTVETDAIVLTVTNLTPTCSNALERCTDLILNDWKTVVTFGTSSEVTNVSDALTNTLPRAFYRLRSWTPE